MEDIEVNTDMNNLFLKPNNQTKTTNNILFKPTIEKMEMEDEKKINKSTINQSSVLNRSSMMTYGKIVCCMCSAVIEANQKGMCSTCEKNEIDITEGITKNVLMHYCKGCDRYMRPPWVRCEMESSDMMSLCLSKIKGLGKVKIVDTSFVWTEPHSKIIKLKLTIMKELNKTNVQTSFIVEFKVEWTQCDDCKKTFTPHIWNASVQVRQKVSHKRTFLLLEQIILKHSAHTKALNVKEMPEGVDFYFHKKSGANSLIDFISSVFPIKTKESKQLVSHDQNSNIFNYKYSIMVEIAPVCPDDLIVLDKVTSKELGGVGPVLLCYKVSSRIHLIDPLNFNSYEFDENTYWRYNFRSYVDRSCLQEFLIINVDEEIDYKKLYAKNNDTSMTIDSVPFSKQSNNASKSTNYKNIPDKNKSVFGLQKKDLKVVTVQCILNNSVQDGNMSLITVRTHLGEKIRPGDIFLGYDLTSLIMNHGLEDIMANNSKIPDYILVKKKFKRSRNKKRVWKLKHLDKDVEMGKPKDEIEKDKQYEEFLRDIEENKDLRKNINIYKDDEALRELEKKFNQLDVDEEKEDSEIDIKVEELLQDLTIHDKEEDQKRKGSFDINSVNNEDDKDDIILYDKDGKLIGKRDRKGDKI